jgi:hypothetical protein
MRILIEACGGEVAFYDFTEYAVMAHDFLQNEMNMG